MMEDIWKVLQENALTSFTRNAVRNYLTTMKTLVFNTVNEDLSFNSPFILMAVVTLSGMFSLAVGFYCIYLCLKFIRWLVFGVTLKNVTPRSPRHGMQLNGKSRQHDASRIAESRRWIKQACCDLESAKNDFDGHNPAPEWVCFKCQQVTFY